MVWESPKEAMPWVGLYVVVASFICTLAMAVDAIQGIWYWKLWFPNRFFTLNASTITLIAIAMKLPVDLSVDDDVCNGNIVAVKVVGIFFLITMLANFLPSLGVMDDTELLMNMVALGILVTTIAVNIGIQSFTGVFIMPPFILPIFIFVYLWPFSIAMTISASRRKLEHRYKESQRLLSTYQEKRFSSKGLRSYVKKYWMMTETRNPQFVVACSSVSSAFGVICLFFSFLSIIIYIQSRREKLHCDTSDYKWSLNMISTVQSAGTIAGSIAPIFRCLSSIGHYNLSKEWSKNYLNVFRVEAHWIKRLQQWKHRHVHSYIPGRHCKIVFHNVKNIFLSFCIVLHIFVLVICKTICLVPRTFLILLSYFWRFIKLSLKRFQKVASTPTRNGTSDIKEYTMYVVQIEEDAKLSDSILRNTLRYITQVLIASEEKQPRNLIVLLEKSTGFNGVAVFENEQVQHLYQEETHNCWSLVIVTLTSIAITLPNIAYGHVKLLLSSLREGLQIVRHIEECLYGEGDDDVLEARKAAKRAWAEVEVYCSWLQFDLQKIARKGKTSKDILKLLGDEAEKIMREFKSGKKASIDQSPYKFILAGSMYGISRSMLLHFNEQNIWLSDEEIFEQISTMIADILFACFTNLPRVIKLKCHHHAIKKRAESIRNAAELFGKSKKILKMLKVRQLPNMDLQSRAYIDKWHVILKSQVLIDDEIPYDVASSTSIEPASPSCSEPLIVSIM
ncbi:hypothetical protein SSX86_012501 [Deinandra increscens subsp. villosa]|uniref:Uncharacterized protein n=1 Tax=Deinandra increscens subsp. villosa TaxID=3103831 RepID=A0AAP0D8J5_9ASTR